LDQLAPESQDPGRKINRDAIEVGPHRVVADRRCQPTIVAVDAQVVNVVKILAIENLVDHADPFKLAAS
jgi:hypothetical protein